MTKKQKALYEAYSNSNYRRLSEVYSSWSKSKEIAYSYCLDMQDQLNGYDGRICSFNTFSFTYAFIYEDPEGYRRLYYITKEHNYDFYID